LRRRDHYARVWASRARWLNGIMKPLNFASLLLIAAALAVWAFQHSVPSAKAATALAKAIAR